MVLVRNEVRPNNYYRSKHLAEGLNSPNSHVETRVFFIIEGDETNRTAPFTALGVAFELANDKAVTHTLASSYIADNY